MTYKQQKKRMIENNEPCAICGKPASDLDHLVGGSSRRTLMDDPNNLCPLCHECHYQKTFGMVMKTIFLECNAMLRIKD